MKEGKGSQGWERSRWALKEMSRTYPDDEGVEKAVQQRRGHVGRLHPKQAGAFESLQDHTGQWGMGCECVRSQHKAQ